MNQSGVVSKTEDEDVPKDKKKSSSPSERTEKRPSINDGAEALVAADRVAQRKGGATRSPQKCSPPKDDKGDEGGKSTKSSGNHKLDGETGGGKDSTTKNPEKDKKTEKRSDKKDVTSSPAKKREALDKREKSADSSG